MAFGRRYAGARHRAEYWLRPADGQSGLGTWRAAARGVMLPVAAPSIRGSMLGLGVANANVLLGLEAQPVRVEVACTRGPAFFQMVGLAEAVVRESRVRVTSALLRVGVLLDEYAVTVNLAPAELRKSGAALDLAVAVAVMVAIGKLSAPVLVTATLLGELSLNGKIRPTRGVLPLLIGARRSGCRLAIVPFENRAEAGLVEGLDVRVAQDLSGVIQHLEGQKELPRASRTAFSPRSSYTLYDLSQVRGQSAARRALEIAAAGGHNLLFIGPPGGGKTLLARSLGSILPPMSFEEALEVTAIHSVAGLVDPAEGGIRSRPFRAPHHSVSTAGLIGGGDMPRPGEVSLAHRGVLFLDELAEFRRGSLEALRQPIEDGQACIVRVRARAAFPAVPLLVAATNPCPCGYHGHPKRTCRCSPELRNRYLSRLSGPMLDRFDLHCSVPPVDACSLVGATQAESSTAVRQRVMSARQVQRDRQLAGDIRGDINSSLSLAECDRIAARGHEAQTLLMSAIDRFGMSARAYLRILRVARTIADLEGSSAVETAHIAEAIQGRLLDRVTIA